MKKFIRTIALCGLAVLMSGCFKYRIHVDVTSDGKVSGYTETLLKETVLTMSGTDSDTAVNQMIEQSKKDNPDAEYTPLSEGEGEEVYKGFRMTGIPENTFDVKVEKNIVTCTVDLSHSQADLSEYISATGQKATMDQLKKEGVEAVISITMPNKIESANIGTVDGRTVTIDLLSDFSADHQLVVTCKTGILSSILLFAGAGLLVLALIAFFLTRKNKKA